MSQNHGPDSQLSRLASEAECVVAPFLRAIKPDPVHMTVSEWADENRYLSSRSSAEPGRWRTSRTPYLREPMDALSPQDPCESVVLLFGSQLGKSETGFNWTGYNIDVAPGPMLMVQPTDLMSKKVVRQRLDPAIAESPSLSSKVSEPKSRDGGNSMESKEFPGGILLLTGANSPANLASMPIRYLFLDEIDRYPGDVGGEGDPINLARARTRTFGNSKELITSTPTEAGSSRIDLEFQETDQRHFYVPCPECGHRQTLRFGNLIWDKVEENGKTIDKPETVSYQCEDCGCLIPEHKKTWMLESGEWVAHKPEVKRRKGYFLNSLYSPLGWYSWEQIVRDFLESKNKPALLKTFVNTVLAEVWHEKGDVPDWEAIYRRRKDYAFGTCPKGVLFLTAGVDVQRDRIEVEIVGWGRDFKSWSVDYIVFSGNTAGQEIWDDVWSLLKDSWSVEGSGARLPLSRMAVDSSDQTQLVYTQVRKIADERVMAIKGDDNQIVLVSQPKYMDIDYNGRTIYRGVALWKVGVSVIKTELYGFFRLLPPLEEGEPTPTGFCEFPQYEKEYFLQLTSEQRIRRTINGQTKSRWEKKYERNEALDCRVYARAAAFVFGLDRFTEEQWLQLESRLVEIPEIKQNKRAKNEQKANPFTGKSGNFL